MLLPLRPIPKLALYHTMAIQYSKTGLMKGKISNLTFYVRYGEQIVRQSSNPNHHDRKSPAQLNHRMKITLMTEFLSPIKDFLKTSFKSVVSGKAYHQASSYLMKNAFTIIDDEPVLDCQKALVCQGFLTPPENAAVRVEDGRIVFSWTDNSGQASANADDQLVFLLYDAWFNFRSSMELPHTASRSDESFSPVFERVTYGDFHVYMAFRKDDDTDISNSVYAGMIHLDRMIDF